MKHLLRPLSVREIIMHGKFVFLGTIILAVYANARPLAAKSVYGKFIFEQKGEGCEIAFKHRNGKTYQLISNAHCSDNGFDALLPLEQAGGINFPFNTACNEEVRFFSTLTSAGGNKCEGSTFWTILVAKEGAWSSSEIGKCSDLEKIETQGYGSDCKMTLTFVESISSKENRKEIVFNALKKNDFGQDEQNFIKGAFTEFHTVTANWEALQSTYAREASAGGTFQQIGFSIPSKSKYWNYYDKEEKGKLYIQSKKAMNGCPSNNIWIASYSAKGGTVKLETPHQKMCIALMKKELKD